MTDILKISASLFFLLIFTQACNASTPNLTVESNTALSTKGDVMPDKHKKTTQWQQATIQYMELEGGFFGLITDKGEKLLPMNLATEYRQVGAIVKVQGQLLTDMMTIQQWGTPFKITKIELIKAGKPRADSSLY